MKRLLLVNLGTPDAPDTRSVRRYLREFLSDPRVVEVPRPVWWAVLRFFILPFRPRRVARLYQSIWTDAGAPMRVISASQAKKLEAWLADRGQTVAVDYAMTYGNPSLRGALDKAVAEGVTDLMVLPLYPQYSASTVGSVIDVVAKWCLQQRALPSIRWLRDYHDHPAYIEALTKSVSAHAAKIGQHRFLLMSFHGIPQSYADKGDPYPQQCHATAQALARALQLPENRFAVSFQSRFGPSEWLKPYTDETLEHLAQADEKHVDVICPGFASDCLETIEEICEENRDRFIEAGGQSFHYVPALNDSDDHIDALGRIVLERLIGTS